VQGELGRLELVERLVSMVPPPKANQVQYHGVWGDDVGSGGGAVAGGAGSG